VTHGRLSETLALLLREKHGRAAALSPDAERAIRRRVAARWAGSVGALVAVGALGTATVVGAYGDPHGDESATHDPIPTPTIGVAATTFPIAGGPEFVSPAAGLKCGDPVPKPHPKEHDVGITLIDTNASLAGQVVYDPGALPTVIANLSQTVGTNLGIVADSGISLIIARDGVVAAVIDYSPPQMGWNALHVTASTQGQNSTQLAAPWIYCPGADTSKESSFAPGVYDVVGMTRAFSTPESVALYQALGLSNDYSGWNLDPNRLDPQAIYLPGSYDCAQSITQGAPARACLADFTPDAKVDAEASTVTMLYDTKDLVDQFSAVLVSEPISVTIPGNDSLGWLQNSDPGSVGVFDSIDAFTCGASAGYVSIGNQSSTGVFLSLDGTSADEVRAGGGLHATAWGMGVPDGSKVELLAGARIVYLQNSTVTAPNTNAGVGVDTVVASAAAIAAQPVTTDRFQGPQQLALTVEPLTVCPGIDATSITWSTTAVLVGQWRIVTPDGTVTTVDTGQYLNVN